MFFFFFFFLSVCLCLFGKEKQLRAARSCGGGCCVLAAAVFHRCFGRFLGPFFSFFFLFFLLLRQKGKACRASASSARRPRSSLPPLPSLPSPLPLRPSVPHRGLRCSLFRCLLSTRRPLLPRSRPCRDPSPGGPPRASRPPLPLRLSARRERDE